MSAAAEATPRRFEAHTPLGLRFWDLATGVPLGEGLSVSLVRVDGVGGRAMAQVNPLGVFVFHTIPGFPRLHRWFGEGSRPPVDCEIFIEDIRGWFAPMRLRVAAPVRGVVGTGESPSGSGAGRGLALMSSPTRPVPFGCVAVRCELVDEADRPVRWARITAELGDGSRWQGISDRQGRAIVVFPRPREAGTTVSFSGSPPQGVGSAVHVSVRSVDEVSRAEDLPLVRVWRDQADAAASTGVRQDLSGVDTETELGSGISEVFLETPGHPLRKLVVHRR